MGSLADASCWYGTSCLARLRLTKSDHFAVAPAHADGILKVGFPRPYTGTCRFSFPPPGSARDGRATCAGKEAEAHSGAAPALRGDGRRPAERLRPAHPVRGDQPAPLPA